MSNWRLAKSLIQLRDQINLAYPNRSKISDGSVGDLRHQALPSDHNPNAEGVVTAIDVTHDPQNGLDGRELSQRLTTDPRMKYVIFAGRIFKARTGKWETYRGPNRHDHHVHISVLAKGYDDVSPWFNLEPGQSEVTATRRTLKRGDSGKDVTELQKALGIKADGRFGNGTEHALREFQAHHGLTVDGKAGPKVYAVLFRD